MAHFLPFPKFRATFPNGDPLIGGLLYSYAAGTTTPLATYDDKSETAPNTNPIVLDANGEASVWLKDSLSYKIVLADPDDVIMWTVDNVQHINDGTITPQMVVSGFLSNDVPGHALMADGYLSANTAGRLKMANGFLSADIEGQPKMANGFLSANTAGRLKMADNFLSADAEGQPKMAAGFLSADATGRAKMANGYLLNTHRAALGQQISATCGSFTTSSSTPVDVTNLSVSITTTGRPVFIGLIADGAGNGRLDSDATATNPVSANFYFVRVGVTVANYDLFDFISASPAHQSGIPSCLWTIEVPAAGTYVYKFQAQAGTGNTVHVKNSKLIAYEL